MQSQIDECRSNKDALWFPTDAELKKLGEQSFCLT